MSRNFKFLALALLFNASFLQAQNKMTAQEAAVKIAERIVSSTTYKFENTKTGETYETVKGLPVSNDVRVQSKYNQWHYTNGVTNIALLELANEIKVQKYEDYVLKNMNFVFNEGNLDFFRQQYDNAFKAGGWQAIRSLSWHMIFRGKRLDDNGPMGASLIELQKNIPTKHS